MSTIGATPCPESGMERSSLKRGCPVISVCISAGRIVLFPASIAGDPGRGRRLSSKVPGLLSAPLGSTNRGFRDELPGSQDPVPLPARPDLPPSAAHPHQHGRCPERLQRSTPLPEWGACVAQGWDPRRIAGSCDEPWFRSRIHLPPWPRNGAPCPRNRAKGRRGR